MSVPVPHSPATPARTALRPPLTWLFVIVAGLVALATTFGYLGGFLDPDGNARNMPLALVNEDRGATVGGQQINFGDQVIDPVAAPNPRLGDAVRWTVLPSRRAALAEIGRDEYFAALVVPADFSERVLAIGEASSAAPVPATVEVLTNPASGATPGRSPRRWRRRPLGRSRTRPAGGSRTSSRAAVRP
jgi:YhgE/Pip-like protein